MDKTGAPRGACLDQIVVEEMSRKSDKRARIAGNLISNAASRCSSKARCLTLAIEKTNFSFVFCEQHGRKQGQEKLALWFGNSARAV
jgi:hypothetical protein